MEIKKSTTKLSLPWPSVSQKHCEETPTNAEEVDVFSMMYCREVVWALTVNIPSSNPCRGHGENTHEIVDVPTRQHHVFRVGFYLFLLRLKAI